MRSIDLQPRGGLTTSWCVCAAAMTALMTATIIGNSAVLVALRRVRTAPAHYPLASLAAADLLVGVFILPIAAVRELFVFQLNPLLCSCWKVLDVLSCTSSILSLCALGWERWSGITAPLARARRARSARLLAGLVWPVSFAVALPTAFISSPRHIHPGEEVKACPEDTNVGYVFFSTTLSFYLPAAVMLVLYARILSALSVPPQIRSHRGRSPRPDLLQKTTSSVKQSRQLQIENNNTAQLSPKGCQLNAPRGRNQDEGPSATSHVGATSNIMNRQRRATKTIVRLMALFLACWTPFFVMLPVDSLCDCVRDSIWEWCTWLGYCNSALNPLVYAAASPSVRRALHASLSSSKREDVPLSPGRR